MDIMRLQTRLKQLGFAIGAIDGVAGARTWAGILAHTAQRKLEPLLDLGAAAAKHLPAYGIADSAARAANFVGQAAHETGRFHYMREIWGPTAAQARYEGRRDLGNINAGDGKLYMGRGIFQLTGRANYHRVGGAIGIDLERHPEMVEQPDMAVLTAAYYWRSNGLSALADAGREDDITRRINGGINGIAERRQLVARAKALFA